MLVVGTKDVVYDFDIVFAVIAAPKVTKLVFLSVHNEFNYFAISVHNKLKSSNSVIFDMFLFFMLIINMLGRFLC